MRVLVTGATGYIGSHTCLALIEAGHEVVGIDDYSNSHREVGARLNALAGTDVLIHECDLTDAARTQRVVAATEPDAVVHFAGRKAVGESVADPLRYERINVGSTISLAGAMRTVGVDRIVFSSSCTVYGNPEHVPVDETHRVAPINPYGRTKRDIEALLEECSRAYGWSTRCLRYFNPIGAHPSGQLGEAARGEAVNLMPRLVEAASGGDPFPVFGDDYPTADGTCVRDYVHIVDLARGHVAAVERLGNEPTWDAINLGTGRGSSVFEILAAAQTATGISVPRVIAPRRPGDAAQVFADVSLAARVLSWRSELSLEAMCADAWRWQQNRGERRPA